MKNFMRSLQGDVAAQIESSDVRLHGGALKRMVSAGVMAASAIAAVHSTAAHAQDNGYAQREARVLSRDAGRIGQVVGQAAGKDNNIGNEIGSLLSIGASTLAKAMSGQKVNSTEVGATTGQIAGAVAGYMGTRKSSAVNKTVAIVGGGMLGTVIGGRVGNAVDQSNEREAERQRIERANASGPNVHSTAADQQQFLRSMNAVMNNQHQGAGSAQNNPYSSFSGYMGQLISQSPVRLAPSGAGRNASDAQVNAVGNAALALTTVARQYQASEDNWDSGFMYNASNQAKNTNYWRVAGDLEALKLKIKDYIQVRNAAAVQGADVTVFDRTVNDRTRDLKPITNYGFAVSRVAPGY